MDYFSEHFQHPVRKITSKSDLEALWIATVTCSTVAEAPGYFHKREREVRSCFQGFFLAWRSHKTLVAL